MSSGILTPLTFVSTNLKLGDFSGEREKKGNIKSDKDVPFIAENKIAHGQLECWLISSQIPRTFFVEAQEVMGRVNWETYVLE